MYTNEVVAPRFGVGRSPDEQTEPVDFSTAPDAGPFAGPNGPPGAPGNTVAGQPMARFGVPAGPGVPTVPGGPPGPGPNGAVYSRESSPDSGGSHYLDYRDANGEFANT